jgi:DNA-binding transcriptional MerR regulator
VSEQLENAEKEFYRINEVCQATDTQPYVLRFWESEFPQLSATRQGSGQRVYRRQDVDLVKRIKHLLYEESYTLEDARRQIDSELRTERSAPSPEPRPAVPHAPAPLLSPVPQEVVPRRRYDDAVDEIDHLRLQLKEAELGRHKAESRAERAIHALEDLLRVLEG